MKKTVLDTSVLIRFWMQQALSKMSSGDVRKGARTLIERMDTNAIVTPVYVECISGTRTDNELKLMREYLREFCIIDEGHVSDADWIETIRSAKRIPKDGKPRQLGDCLINAIARRLNHDVFSHDKRIDG